MLGICQGGVFTACYAALFPEKVRNRRVHGHADRFPRRQERAANRLRLHEPVGARADADDIDALVEAYGTAPGSMVGFAFLMMNPVSNFTKYTIDLIDVMDDEAKLLNFLRMERWIADRPDHPGEVLRQWFKDLYQDNKLDQERAACWASAPSTCATSRCRCSTSTRPATRSSRCRARKGVGGHFGTKDYTELAVPGGHIGTFVGSKAQKILAPSLADWFKARSGSQED